MDVATAGGTTPLSSASLPSLSLVGALHAAVLRLGAVLEPSLIHACSASGDPDSSRSVFDELPAREQTVSALTALASAMSANGRRRQELGLSRGKEGEMDDKAACARAGMVAMLMWQVMQYIRKCSTT